VKDVTGKSKNRKRDVLIIVFEERQETELIPEYHEEDNSQDCSEDQR
jgi:hypothetical protein